MVKGTCEWLRYTLFSIIRSDGGSDADNEGDEDQQVFCTVRADELPEEPKNSFLMRQTEKKSEEGQEADADSKDKRRWLNKNREFISLKALFECSAMSALCVWFLNTDENYNLKLQNFIKILLYDFNQTDETRIHLCTFYHLVTTYCIGFVAMWQRSNR